MSVELNMKPHDPPDGGRLLDLGCGSGLPTTKLLAERFEARAGLKGIERPEAADAPGLLGTGSGSADLRAIRVPRGVLSGV
jgi:trans-aconitate methyltransferase